MITHHSSSQELLAFGKGELPAGDSVAISAHLEYCTSCANKLGHLEADIAQDWSKYSSESILDTDELEPILDSIFTAPIHEDLPVPPLNEGMIEVGGQKFELPTVLSSLAESGLNWRKMPGGVSLALVKLDNQNICSFLYMKPGGGVAMHTHKGKETTLVIGGSFFDAEGEYRKGDFIQRGEEDNHTSQSNEGCLCFTVQDNPVVFTRGLPRLFNPINRLLMG